jgi:type II secretory pathway pseudopilin PulG
MLKNRQRNAFTLLEIVPVLTVASLLLMIILSALNPSEWFAEARNTKRKHHISVIADSIIEYSRDNDLSLLYQMPENSQEICADILTGNCAGLFDINVVIGTYMDSVPIDPSSQDESLTNEHSRYFIIRSGQRFTVSAPDAEIGATIEVTR